MCVCVATCLTYSSASSQVYWPTIAHAEREPRKMRISKNGYTINEIDEIHAVTRHDQNSVALYINVHHNICISLAHTFSNVSVKCVYTESERGRERHRWHGTDMAQLRSQCWLFVAIDYSKIVNWEATKSQNSRATSAIKRKTKMKETDR